MNTRLPQCVITAEEMVPSRDEGMAVPHDEGEPRRCPIFRKQHSGLATPRCLMLDVQVSPLRRTPSKCPIDLHGDRDSLDNPQPSAERVPPQTA